MRNIVFGFESSPAFARALRDGDQELGLPIGESVTDGEWVLAIFEIGLRRRATAAAARGLLRGPETAPVLAFERRDWERLLEFAEAGSLGMHAAAAAPPDPPTERSVFVPDEEQEDFALEPEPCLPEGSPRLLLVDDDAEICALMTTTLAAVGLSADTATTGEDALVRLRATPPDLVILDWNLPRMTGLELCRVIRKDPALSRLPVLFLTAHAGTEDMVEAFASGADDFVVKPFRAPELNARIFSLLRRSRMAVVRVSNP